MACTARDNAKVKPISIRQRVREDGAASLSTRVLLHCLHKLGLISYDAWGMAYRTLYRWVP